MLRRGSVYDSRPVRAKGTTRLEPIDVLRTCLRRWYITLPILAIAASYAYGSYTSVKPVYYANSVVGVAGSNEQTQFNPDGRPTARNGLLDIGGAGLIMNLVVLGFDDPEVRSRVVAGGGKGNFTVRMFPAPPAAVQAPLPLIMIEATEPDAGSAAKTVELAASQADAVLLAIQQQASVPESQMVRAIRASSPKAVRALPSRTKSSLLILGAGAAFAILAGVVVDALITRWQQWLHKRPTSGLEVSDTPDASAKPST